MRANDTRRSQTAATALQMSVAAPVRARTVGFRLRRRVCTTHPGAQWTARPTNSLRLCASAVKNSTSDFVAQCSSTAYDWPARGQAALNSYGIWHMRNWASDGRAVVANTTPGTAPIAHMRVGGTPIFLGGFLRRSVNAAVFREHVRAKTVRQIWDGKTGRL